MAAPCAPGAEIASAHPTSGLPLTIPRVRKYRLRNPARRRLSKPHMDTATHQPPHLPTPHTGLIDARLSKIEDVARDTKLYTFRARRRRRSCRPTSPARISTCICPTACCGSFRCTSGRPIPTATRSASSATKTAAAARATSSTQMKVGDQIKISAPRNNFPLVEDAEHVVLFAGGIGITPIWCMAQELAAHGRSWKLYYACRSRADMAFLETLKKLDPEFVPSAFRRRGRRQVLDLAAAVAEAPAERAPLLLRPQSDAQGLRGRGGKPAAQSTFMSNISPPKEEAAGQESKLGGFWVELARSGEEYFIPEGKKVLEVLFEAGVDVDYSCELGICGACETRVISGTPIHHDSVLSEEEQASNEKVMICCCGCATERLVLDM